MDGVFWRREFIVRAHTAAQVFYFPVWLTVSRLSSSAGEPVVRLICIFVHPGSAILSSSFFFFFFMWTAHETCLSDWLVLRGRWIRRNHWLDLCWGGKQPFLRIRFSLIQSVGKSKENTERVVLLLELLWVKSLDLHVLNLYFQSNVECTHRQADKVLFWFYAWTHLHSLCPCLAADYDVHSLLSSWFWLASNQWWAPVSGSPCYCWPDYPRVHCWVSSLVTCSRP